jgi:imidazolonepropionase-like amidohydrolase
MADVVLANALVLDPVAGQLHPDRHVVVEKGRIVDVASRPPGGGAARTVDVGGRVVMPGLCDGHVHVTAVTPDFALLRRWSTTYVAARAGHVLRDMLLRGFTTVRDVGGADWGLAKAVEEGHLVGPRILFCGHAISQTGGHGDMRGPGEEADEPFCVHGLGRIADGVAAVQAACRDEIRKGATHLKLMVSGGVASPTDRITNTQFARDEMTAAVEEAEAAGIYVTAHAYTSRAVARAVECGVRGIEHGNLLDETTLGLMRQCGAFLIPTLSVVHAVIREGLEAGFPGELREKMFTVFEAGARVVEMAHRAGVKLVYGTDLLGSLHRYQLDEFSIRGEVLKPVDVIRSATSVAAELFQLEGQVGVVAPGARADLLVLDGNPLEDLGVMRDPETRLKLIMKDGVIHKNTLPR